MTTGPVAGRERGVRVGAAPNVTARTRRLWWATALVVAFAIIVEISAAAVPATSRTAVISVPSVFTTLIAAAVCGWFAWRAQGAERRWRLLLAVAMVVLAASVAVGVWEAGQDVVHLDATNIAGVISLASAAVSAAVLLTYPSGGGSGWQHSGAALRGMSRGWYRTVLLDGLAVVGSLFLLLWANMLRQVFASLRSAGQTPWTADITVVLADATLIVILVLVAVFRDPHSPIAWALLGAGFFTVGATTSVVTYVAATGGVASAPVLFAGTTLGPLLLALAAATAVPEAPGAIEDDEPTSRRTRVRLRLGIRAHALLPYALVGVSFLVIGLRHLTSDQRFDAVEVTVGVTLLVLVIVRQLLVVLDNANLAARVRESQSQLRYQAFHDSLTGLPNREMFHDRLTSVTRRHAETALPFALLYLDLDGFKPINDAFGHDAGDDVLRVVGRRLEGCIRPGDVAARLGGDEFAVLVAGNDDPTTLAERVRAACSAPMRVGRYTHTVGVSAGLVLARSTDSPADPETVLRQADEAMYAAKANGKGTLEAVHLHEQPRAAIPELHHDLARALGGDPHAGTIDVLYQPIVELSSGHVHALEALARWSHPTRGDIPPATFVPAAEAAGLVETLDSFVLDRACRDVGRLRAREPETPLVHVNVSGTLAAHDALVDTVDDCLRRHRLPPRSLVLEITETERIPDMAAAAAVLSRLTARGVQIALDDVGAGHTTLEALQVLPLRLFKLDRALVRGAGDPRRRALLDGVLAIASRLNIPVIAEGIETPTDLAAVADTTCRYGQGYFYGHPHPLPHPTTDTSPAMSVG
ncbi:MAG: putative bifunctional diguanylate cyclase/phosphodiesterase [Frankia sp.]